MAQTASKMIPLETKAADFELPDVISKNLYNLQDIRGKKGTVLMLICNHCSFVKHVKQEIIGCGIKWKENS